MLHNILTVDDTPADRALYRHYLSSSQRYTFNFIEAGSGYRGLELWEQYQPDVVILDYKLPDIDGLKFLRRLRSSPSKVCPVIMVTGYGDVTTAVEAIRAGAQDFFFKDRLTPQKLQMAVSRVVEDVQLYTNFEESLREREDRLRLAIASAELGTWDWDLATNRLTWDRGCKAMFGLPPDAEISIEVFFEALHPEDRGRLEQLVEASITPSSSGTYDTEYRAIGLQDGIERWIKAKGQAYFSEDRQPLRFIGTVMDITERKQAEQKLAAHAQTLEQTNQVLNATTTKLKERNKDLNQFVYVASHDLKTPLNSIHNLAEWLQEDLGSIAPPESQQHLELLTNRINRMQRLIDALLSYARVGRMRESLERVNTRELLLELINMLSPPSNITINLIPPFPVFQTNELALNQVFSNLIANAIKYGCVDQRGNISISVTEYQDYYKFIVADDGPGIPPFHHEKIFGIFETLQDMAETSSTGIGLAIVKRLVETEGGSIWVESDLGEGTTFYFTWPKG